MHRFGGNMKSYYKKVNCRQANLWRLSRDWEIVKLVICRIKFVFWRD